MQKPKSNYSIPPSYKKNTSVYQTQKTKKEKLLQFSGRADILTLQSKGSRTECKTYQLIFFIQNLAHIWIMNCIATVMVGYSSLDLRQKRIN